MNFFIGTYRLLALTINLVIGGCLLVASYSYLIPPDRLSLPHLFTLAFPCFFFIEVFLLLQIFLRPRKFVLLPLLFLLLSAKSIQNYFPIHFTYPKKETGNTIQIISYNIQRFASSESTHKGKSNTVLDLLCESNADIICLQEYASASSPKYGLTQKEIEKILSQYPYRHIFTPKNSIMGIACFSKFPIKKAKPIAFKTSQNSACLYQLDIGGKTLTLINCHLESNHLEKEDRELYSYITKHPTQTSELLPEAKKQLWHKLAHAGAIRATQARTIRQIADDIPNAILICGDFNDTPQSYAYRKIRGKFNDAYVSTQFGPNITYHESRFWFRIDHILYNTELRAISTDIIKKKYSDHYPIQAIFQWNQKSD